MDSTTAALRSSTARPSESTADRITKYEASIRRLESIRGDYIRRRPLYAKSFSVLAVAGFACFAFGALVGLWGSISATLVSVAGYAMVGVRVRELTLEIDTLRGDIERLRRGTTR